MKPLFKNAIVRQPSPGMTEGLSSASLGYPDYAMAMDQHAAYVEALRSCGLEVRVLEADPGFPDSCFVEDVALCTPQGAILTNPGAPSRNGEKLAMEAVLLSFYEQLEYIDFPGTLDAGDVMMVGEHYYIGLSERSNQAGANALIAILEKQGKTGTTVPLRKMLHLKSGVSYLEEQRMLVTGEFSDHPAFAGFDRLVVEPEEAYAANSLWVNDTVLVPAGFPSTLERIQEAGYKTLVLDVSEFQKLDGGLSCLSLRF